MTPQGFCNGCWRWRSPRWPRPPCSTRCGAGSSGSSTDGSTGARYDAERTVDAFAAGLQGAIDLDSVRDGLVGVVHRALEPAHVSV